MTKKSRKKSPRRGRANGGQFQPGGPQGPGRGPRKGAPNAGRPPDEFKKLMRGVASRTETIRRLRKLAGGAKGVADEIFLKAFKECADRGYGKAVQPLEHAGPDGEPLPLETADRALGLILGELAGIAARTRTRQDPRTAE